MKIACIGAGYVGGPTMVVIAKHCPEHEVVVVDVNQSRIDAWNSDDLPIFEPGLKPLVMECRGRNLFFSTDKEKHVADADVVFVSVNTPTKTRGIGAGKAADLTYWEGAARLIAACSTPGQKKIVVEKSTVPVKTAEAIERVLSRCAQGTHFEVLSNPEFLAEGTAIRDLTQPDRVLIGHHRTESGTLAANVLASLYAHWVPEERIVRASLWSAELAKLTANAMLAQRVSSMNAMSAICEATGADIQEISHSVGTDSRVGPKFLNASVGFGGSCFQKDILNLVYICETLNLPEVAEYWMNIIKINEFQKRRFVHLVVSTLFNTVSGKKISVLGFAFKKDTGDTRETPAIGVCSGLMDDGAVLSVYDPQVSGHDLYMALTAGSRTEWWHPLARQMRDAETDTVKSKVAIAKDAYEACKDSHAVCVLTEWDEFKALDWQRIYDGMAKPAAVFDGRLVLDHDQLRSIGFVVYGIGKPLDPYIAQAIGATH